MANLYDFNGRVALVTGGASGIGFAVASRLLASGARVAIFDLSSQRLDEAAASLAAGDRLLTLQGDASRSHDADEAVERTVEAFGQLDALVCSAGVAGDSLRTLEVSDDEWKRVHAINLDGIFYFNRAAIRAMESGGYGRIVNVASIAGKEGNPMAAAYSSSKAAVIGMTKSVGKDVAGSGILVNSVAPAVIHTPILDQISEEHRQYMISRIPLGRPGTVEEAASLICFLASEELSFSTGFCFDLSGGRAVF